MKKNEFIKSIRESNGDILGVMRINSVTMDILATWLTDTKFCEELESIQSATRFIILSVIAKKAMAQSDLKAAELYFKLTNTSNKDTEANSGLIVQVLNKELKPVFDNSILKNTIQCDKTIN